jgi:hypothetical protein
MNKSRKFASYWKFFTKKFKLWPSTTPPNVICMLSFTKTEAKSGLQSKKDIDTWESRTRGVPISANGLTPLRYVRYGWKWLELNSVLYRMKYHKIFFNKFPSGCGQSFIILCTGFFSKEFFKTNLNAIRWKLRSCEEGRTTDREIKK